MRLIPRHYQERGDTIIEVLFAVTVFAMVAIGGLAIMNQGISAAQRSLEITLVRQQIDAQAEAIRYIHQAYVATFQKDITPTAGAPAQWVAMTSKANGKGANKPSEFGQTTANGCADLSSIEKPFILNARTATIASSPPATLPPANGSLPPFAQVIYNADSSINQAYGLWVEAVPSAITDGPGFVDFHIRACWNGPGSSTPMTLGTIVRLYEPR